MSWLQKLSATYDLFEHEAGVMPEGGKVPLYPLYHSTQQAHISCLLSLDGGFVFGGARVLVEKSERVTLIPVTEFSSSRTSAPEPHPLHDKLQYLSTAYVRYGGKEKALAYQQHLDLLAAWCGAPHCPERVKAVFAYLQKDRLLEDLLAEQIFFVNDSGHIPEKWLGDKELTPAIYKTGVAPLDSFVRFDVLDETNPVYFWNDKAVWESWIRFQSESAPRSCLCYASGKVAPAATLCPKKIRNPGDGAKLISANDSSGFTYRGRFATPNEAYCVSRELSEKAHSALRWLISKQAYRFDEQVILAWMVDERQLPSALLDCDSEELAGMIENELPEEDLDMGDTESLPVPAQDGSDFAYRFRKAVRGYHARLGDSDEAVVMGLESATPGRLSIFYYSELPAKTLIENVQHWHTSCSWPQHYKNKQDGVDAKGKPQYKKVFFTGVPSTRDLIEAVYGDRVDAKLKASIRKRLLPCITERARLPVDIMQAAARRASNPVAMERWQAAKVLGIACALIRKHYNEKYDEQNKPHTEKRNKKEVWPVAVLKDRQSEPRLTDEEWRSYLFGRMLAYARHIEEMAQWKAGNDARQTNAERMQQSFTQHPAHTWDLLEKKLFPYLDRLKSSSYKVLERQMRDVMDQVPAEQFNDKKLSPLYLLGYSSQLNEFWSFRKNAETEEGADK
ncbi:type I-C CRISPR-associated protein Cas8c/Csd1 [Christensenellaceae bacterium OttesenSCG-928-M15]|nr:type I-C CRISPR-associated protein Cas8c/Csd1 [Christensenellaceae bacterium OttesenSCG-928-M15]